MKIIRIGILFAILLSSTTLFAMKDDENLGQKLQESLKKQLEKLSLKEKETGNLKTKYECEQFLLNTGAGRFIDICISDKIPPLYELAKKENGKKTIDDYVTTTLRKEFKDSRDIEDVIALTLYYAEYQSARNNNIWTGQNLLMAQEVKKLIFNTFLLNNPVGHQCLCLIIRNVTTNINLDTFIRLCKLTFLHELITSKHRINIQDILETFSQNLNRLLKLARKNNNTEARHVLVAVAEKFNIPIPTRTSLKALVDLEPDHRFTKGGARTSPPQSWR